jgi:hypothetical protein
MEIKPSNVSILLQRYGRFIEAVLRSVHYHFPAPNVGPHAILTIAALDHQEKRWVTLELRVEGIEEFSIREGPQITCTILSDGANIGFFKGKVYVDLAPVEPTYESISDFLNSNFLIVGKRLICSPAVER